MKRFILLSFVILISFSAKAQMNAGSFLSATSDRITTTNYYFARPNDLTIIVNVVGFVQRPGRYEIANNIDLINLLSLAGGPTSDGALDKVTVTRILKEGDRIRRKEIHFDLEDLTILKSEDLSLFPGDFIAIDRTAWSAFRDGFTVFASGAILITAVTQIINIVK